MLQRVAALATWWQHVATYIAQQLLLKQLESLARAEKTVTRFRHRSFVRAAGEVDAPAVSERSTICAVASSTIVLSFLLLAVPCRPLVYAIRSDRLNAACRLPNISCAVTQWTLTLTLTHTRGADRLFDWKNMLRHR